MRRRIATFALGRFHMKSTPALCLGFALFFCVLARSGAAAQTPTPANDKPVVLPDLTVRGQVVEAPLDSWRYGRIDGFEVLSSISDSAARDLLLEFDRFRHAARIIWGVQARPGARASLLLCGRDKDFAPFVPTEGKRPLSIVYRDGEQLIVVVDLATKIVSADLNTTAVSATELTGIQVDHTRQLYRQYVRLLLGQTGGEAPAWLEEGMTQTILDVEIVDGVLRYGRLAGDKLDGPSADEGTLQADADSGESVMPSNNDALVGDQPFYLALRHEKLLPLDQFFAVPREAPEANTPLGNSVWAKQAYAFMHYCLFARGAPHRAAFGKFVQRASREPVTEPMFRECFGIGYAEMVKNLRFYIANPIHEWQKYTFQPGEAPPLAKAPLTEATDDQIGLLRGDALRLSGQPALAAQFYRQAYRNGARSPDLVASLGALELERDAAEHGAKLLFPIVTAGTATRPWVYHTAVRARLRERLAVPRNATGKLEAPQVTELLTWLFRARQLGAPQAATYQLIAEVWQHSGVRPQSEHLAVLDEGLRYFPQDLDLLERAARLQRDIGNVARAKELATRGAAAAGDAAARERFAALLKEI
jgi:hypothetical protein